MNERFTHLYFLPTYLYQSGSPILIAAGALLKDNQNDSVLVQLKLRNLKKDTLIACKVSVKAFDPSGAELKGVDDFSYLDLNMETGKDFGTQTAIPLEDKTTRRVVVSVTQAVFDNGVIWENKNEQEWEPLPIGKRKELKMVFPDEELQKQYSIEVGGNCTYVPEIIDPFFYCTCGAINLVENGACYNCKREYPSLAEALNVEILTQKKNLRLQEEKYQQALALQNKGTENALEKAISLFTELGDFKDSTERIIACQNRIVQEKAFEKETAQKKKRYKMLGIFAGTAAALVIVIALLATKVIIPEMQNRDAYQNAEALFENGQYDDAIDAFTLLGEYKDASDRAEKARNAKREMQYTEALELAKNGDYLKAMAAFRDLGDYDDAKTQITNLWEKIANRETLSTCSRHTVGLKTDGTVIAIGDNYYEQCDLSNWNDVIAVSTGSFHTVGLKKNGTVIATGKNNCGQCDVSDWNHIVAISTKHDHTIGLKEDGTVIATGDNEYGQCNISNWENIISICAGSYHTVGLREDGTVIATGINDRGQCNVSDWNDIVAISASNSHTVGLKADGTVVATGSNNLRQCNVSDWNDIITISANNSHTVGLKADGTVIITDNFRSIEHNVSDWSDIIAVSAGTFYTVGLKKDGTVIATGSNSYGQCNVSDWNDIKLPER